MMMVIGLMFVFASLLVVASITKHEDEAQMATEMNSAIITQETDDGVKVNDIEDQHGKKTAEEMHVFPITTQTIFFQILMTLSAIYYAMLLTNWGSPDYSSINNAFSFFVTNKASYWC